jgi:branched-chain amino acid transport system ATP-binding protein
MSALLELHDLKHHFGGVWATNGVHLSIDENEIHALIGPNGAGKTTLIQLISGSLPATHGHIRFAGSDITRYSMHARVARGITRSYQITQIFPRLSLLENVRLAVQARQAEFGSSLRFWRPASADFCLLEEAEEWLGQVGLAEDGALHAGDMSHGAQRALELAMALATRPRLLLLDEPMAGMGPDESAHMANLVASLKGKQTVLLVDHDMDIVFRLADRVSVLVAGRIIATGTPAAVRADPAVRRAYLGDELSETAASSA